jgi:hypothetical protein
MKYSVVLVIAGLTQLISAYKFTAYCDANYSTKDGFATFTTSGTHKVGCYADSYKWLSDYGSTCAKMCSGTQQVGIYCVDHSNTKASNSFNKVLIWKTGNGEPDC